MKKSRIFSFGLGLLSAALSGCGLQVPPKELFYANTIDKNGYSRSGKFESNVIANVRCEVTKGLIRAIDTGTVPWLTTFGATISLNLSWEESGSFGPGISYSDSIGGAKLFTLGAGASASAKATRNESITFTLDNAVLIRDGLATMKANNNRLNCTGPEPGTTVQSDLKIDEFIYDKAIIASGGNATTSPVAYPQFSVFQETLTFVITVGGELTPTWKLTRLTVNPGGSFLGANRVKTSTIIVTLGPVEKKASPAGEAELSLQAQVQHNSAFQANATAASLLSQR